MLTITGTNRVGSSRTGSIAEIVCYVVATRKESVKNFQMLFLITTVFRAAYRENGETQLKGLGRKSPRNVDLSVASWFEK